MKKFCALILTLALSACGPVEVAPTSIPSPIATQDVWKYSFPSTIDSSQRYMFYLHGRIIEDQGIQAVSPDFGKYEYEAILERLGSFGFTVISEVRPKNADVTLYARRTVNQINALLEAGVPAWNITVVGASKGSFIAIYVSYILQNRAVKFVLLGSCQSDFLLSLKTENVVLYGSVLSVYDSVDTMAGSCAELFARSNDLSSHDEVVTHIGTGHGILYQPLDEWILPTVEWAGK